MYLVVHKIGYGEEVEYYVLRYIQEREYCVVTQVRLYTRKREYCEFRFKSDAIRIRIM